MLEGIYAEVQTILAMVIALSSSLVTVTSFIKMFKTVKKVKKFENDTVEAVNITREGIVEAFKKSKVNSEWKISISKQIDDKLLDWSKQFLIMFKNHEEARTRLSILNSKILLNTAACKKLTEEERNELEAIIELLDDTNKIIEV